MSVSNRLRYEVMLRDDFTCRYCRSTDNELQIDHVVPKSLGGSDMVENLVTACVDCNSGKSSTLPSGVLLADVTETNVQWANAIREAAQIVESGGPTTDWTQDFWSEWHTQERPGSLPRQWPTVLASYEASGLTVDLMLDAIGSAHKPWVDWPWKYFCGVCANRIFEIHEMAKEIVREDLGVQRREGVGTLATVGEFLDDLGMKP